MKYSRVVRASGCQCQNRNSPGLDPSILQHSGILGAADDVVLNKAHTKRSKKSPCTFFTWIYSYKKGNDH